MLIHPYFSEESSSNLLTVVCIPLLADKAATSDEIQIPVTKLQAKHLEALITIIGDFANHFLFTHDNKSQIIIFH